jgi:DNA-binding NarL/FixJ family response regulator
LTTNPSGAKLTVGGGIMNRPRIILADERRFLREAFAALLADCCDVVETVADGRELVAATVARKPDVVVLETALPVLNGLEAGRQIKSLVPQVKLIYLTACEVPEIVAEAFRAGASGFLLKTSASSELVVAIDAVTRGRVYVTPAANRGADGASRNGNGPRTRNAELSPRRREVLRLLADGYSMKQVARVLKVTPRTVAFHKYGMMHELGLRTSAKLIRFAIERQLVPA